MKKLFSLFVLISISFSCSESDDFSQNNTASKQPIRDVKAFERTKLVKVVFSPGSTSQKNWYFNSDGLIKKITNANGSLFQTFTYDSNKNLIYTYRTGISPWTPSYTYNFTYDGNNHITTVNGQAVTYDAASNKYIFYYTPTVSNDPECPNCYDYADRTEISLTADLLLTNERTYYLSSDGNYSYGGVYAGYNSNNNLVHVSNWTDPSGPSYTFDTKPNPLKTALLPLCRAMTVARGNSYHDRFLIGENNSANNVIFNGYGESDPESEQYIIEYNSNDLPLRTTRKSYYFQTLESTSISALYYYQGDAIP